MGDHAPDRTRRQAGLSRPVATTLPRDTIAAIATPPGRGGIGVVRVSGPQVAPIACALLGELPPPRHARLADFRAADGEPIDTGIALYFAAPGSFTGEDVLELQGHGGVVVMDLLLTRLLELGARVARPGEFSERAFLNGKLDLLQAEAVADLIDAETTAAARLASRTLQGAFSARIEALVDALIHLRTYVEGAIDFPDEEIDFLAEGRIIEQLDDLIGKVAAVKREARQGRLMRDGMQVVLAGLPNAGKSSLLNALAGQESAIVTQIPGTTRDLLHERIQIDGMPVHVIDTAGLRDSDDPIEQEGVRRTRAAMAAADRLLWVYDGTTVAPTAEQLAAQAPPGLPLTLIRNKADLIPAPPTVRDTALGPEVTLCARSGDGLALLHAHLKACMGYDSAAEGEYLARRRHLEAIDLAVRHLEQGKLILIETAAAELLAEELRLAQEALSRITGAFCADDLLGEIFASFCIGK